jgi:hypothetical protein
MNIPLLRHNCFLYPSTSIFHFQTVRYGPVSMHDNPADFALDALIDASWNPDDLEKLNRAYRASSMHTNVLAIAEKNVIQSPQLFVAQIMISIIMALLVGVVFFYLKLTTQLGVQDRLSTLFSIVMNQIFSTLSSLEPLLKERVLFIHVSLFKKHGIDK